MKRLALALAASILGSGCIVTGDHCSRTVTLEWDPSRPGGGFLTADGAVAGCLAAGVAGVDVYVDDAFAARFDCSPGGATITDVSRGSHLFTVEGVDASGLILYRDEVSVDSSACGDQSVIVRPAEGRVNLAYPDWPFCDSSPCYVWFSVHDDIANQTAAVVDGASVPTEFPYVPPPAATDVIFRLPVGNYSLDWFQLVAPPPPPTYTEVAKVCGVPTFTVSPALTTPVQLTLFATGAVCP